MFKLMEYERDGRRYRAVFVPWPEVEKVLGRAHLGTREDDETLIQALLDAGAQWWVTEAEGWVGEEGWGLIGPEILPDDPPYVSRAFIDYVKDDKGTPHAEIHLGVDAAERSLVERGFMETREHELPRFVKWWVRDLLAFSFEVHSVWRRDSTFAVVGSLLKGGEK